MRMRVCLCYIVMLVLHIFCLSAYLFVLLKLEDLFTKCNILWIIKSLI